MNTDDNPTLRGFLVMYVDGYKLYDKNLVHIFSVKGETLSVPDRFVPTPDHEIGSMLWWENGWAVGDNERGRLFKRWGVKPLTVALSTT